MTFALFAIGLLLVVVMGAVHHVGVLTIIRITPHAGGRGHAAVLVTFTGLLLLHSLEIVAAALALAGLLRIDAFGALAGDYSGTWEGLIYFSGMSFVTLGYTDIKAEGPIRLVAMFLSLGGFMVLTWSATLLYSVCGKAWQQGGYSSDEAPGRNS
ncbi:MAG: hypothetical protein KAG89_02580 [Fulvimarina manganoxydans]|uniref:ion channel n=1 Tax=Fulvimarina manganoxydans TaxID=937218 RepID=UPI00235358D8|nr:ion channel [Fulvimarina manganoxydans]MCK5931031.1 hypothetical protein [Fulvimarina manganoxydans]